MKQVLKCTGAMFRLGCSNSVKLFKYHKVQSNVHTSGAAHANVNAASLVDRWVFDKILANPTSLILAVPSLVSKTLGDFRSCRANREVGSVKLAARSQSCIGKYQ